ncbi:hypothetical protein AVEN_127418-1 [Araneus ventricosus]|uniref:Uncharacterized protein n=1 Tax=Araneus ventricosus TaxID=182803 RepID=A0A4Y2RV95_ARAVE|nr:hypothetical protein AVEN_127418-1 [Araneus ventricosus]
MLRLGNILCVPIRCAHFHCFSDATLILDSQIRQTRKLQDFTHRQEQTNHLLFLKHFTHLGFLVNRKIGEEPDETGRRKLARVAEWPDLRKTNLQRTLKKSQTWKMRPCPSLGTQETTGAAQPHENAGK